MLVKNTSDQTLCIPYSYRLGYLIDIVYDNYFLANTPSALDTATSLLSLHQISSRNTSPPLLPTNSFLKTVLSNRIRVYRDVATIKQIAELVAEYPII